jgi:hypothetical protein
VEQQQEQGGEPAGGSRAPPPAGRVRPSELLHEWSELLTRCVGGGLTGAEPLVRAGRGEGGAVRGSAGLGWARLMS